MERRTVLLVLGVVVAAVGIAAAVAVFGGTDQPTASAEPTITASPSASASATESASASAPASPSGEPSEEPAAELSLAWEPVQLEADAFVRGVENIEGRWFAMGQVGPEAAIWTSLDGADWTRSQVPSTRAEHEYTAVIDVAAVGDALVAIGAWGARDSDQFAFAAWRSTDDGATWEETRSDQLALRAVTSGGLGAVGAGWDYGGTLPFDSWIALTEDGDRWQRVDSEEFNLSALHAMTTIGDRIVVVGERSVEDGTGVPAAWYSDDGGETWTAASVSESGRGTMFDVVPLGDGLLAVGGDLTGESPAMAWVSDDGEAWEAITIGPGIARAVAVVEGGVVAVGNAEASEGPERQWTSTDGRTWSEAFDFGSATVQLMAAAGIDITVVTAGSCVVESCDTVLWRGTEAAPEADAEPGG